MLTNYITGIFSCILYLNTIVVGVNENGYGPPSGFCFDTYCGDQPIMDDPRLEDYNVDDKVKFFVDAAHHQVKPQKVFQALRS